MRRDAASFSPVQFVVMSQLRVGADEGETGAEAGSFADSQSVVNTLRLSFTPLQDEGQQAAMASSSSHQSLVVAALAWMQNLLDGLMLLESFRQGEAIVIKLWHSLLNIPTGLLQGDGIGIAEAGGGPQGSHELFTPGGVWADNQASSHHITTAGKTRRQ